MISSVKDVQRLKLWHLRLHLAADKKGGVKLL